MVFDGRWPVSVKGVLVWGGEVVVLRNERDEWELPGGRLELEDESPEAALCREFEEELGLLVEVGAPVDSWIYDVAGKRVVILTYVVSAARPGELTYSDEHSAVATFTLEALRGESMPAGYLRSIASVMGLSR